jgi:hypothetical protein
MGIIDRILRRRRVYTGNTPVVSEEQAHEDPEPTQARVVVPESEENLEFLENLMADEEGRSCGHCIHFNLAAGQARIHAHGEMVLGRILQEFELESLRGSLNPSTIGLCEQWSSNHQEAALMPAEAAPTVASWWLDSTTPYHLRDVNKPCPYFKARPKGWRKLFAREES